jgi:hypothetical protein
MFRFLIEKYKKWRLNKRNAQTLEDIRKAKQCYVDGIEQFMCLCFRHVNYGKYKNEESVHKFIPEFNRENLGAKTSERCSAWWLVTDMESRLKAFDKLIEIYMLKTEKK